MSDASGLSVARAERMPKRRRRDVEKKPVLQCKTAAPQRGARTSICASSPFAKADQHRDRQTVQRNCFAHSEA
jgi:hypothetical protein